jgi:hypothetical protein
MAFSTASSTLFSDDFISFSFTLTLLDKVMITIHLLRGGLHFGPVQLALILLIFLIPFSRRKISMCLFASFPDQRGLNTVFGIKALVHLVTLHTAFHMNRTARVIGYLNNPAPLIHMGH